MRDSVDDWSPSPLKLELQAGLKQKAARNIESLQRKSRVRAPASIVIGEIASGLCEEAQNHQADLVVIGRGMVHDTPGRLGKHAYDIIRQAPCPVINV